MSATRRNFSAEQKADVVRRHLKDKVAISDLAAELGIQPTQIYQWVATVLEQAEEAFQTKPLCYRDSVLSITLFLLVPACCSR